MKIKKLLQRISLYVFAGFILLSLVFLLLINSILTPIAERKIKNGVIKGSDSLYRVNIGHLQLHLFSGNAELEDITLIPDTQLFRKRQQSGRAPAELSTLHVKRIIITGAHPFRYLFHKQADVGTISLENPEGTLSQFPETKQKPVQSKTLYQQISAQIRRISVAQINLEHIRLVYRDFTGGKPVNSSFSELSLKATELLIDSASQQDTTRTLYCRDIVTEIKNFKGRTPDGNYRYSLQSATYSTQGQRLQASGVAIIPLPKELFFVRSKDDRFSLEMKSLTLERFRFRDFQLYQKIEAGKIKAEAGSFDVSGNPNGPVSATDRLVTFPHYTLRHLKNKILIDTLAVSGMEISYHEVNTQAGKTGMIRFTNTSARFLHISNDSMANVRQNSTQLSLSSRFMNTGKLELSASFNLTDPAYSYQVSGHLAGMPLDDINPAVMPLALAAIKKGELNSLDFKLSGNNKKVVGNVRLLYHDLSVVLLGSSPGEAYHAKPLKTLAAKIFVVKSANPDTPGTIPRSARVIFLRPKSSPFFKTLWSSLLSGIKPCAGMGDTQKQAVPKPLTKKEERAKKKAVKKALKEKAKADKVHRKQLEKQLHRE